MFNRKNQVRKNQTGSVTEVDLGVVIVAVVVLGAVYGYIENILKLCRIDHVDGHVGEIVVRIVGIFTGIVGAVAGYF